MFWNYLILITAVSVVLYFFLALIGSTGLAQLVLFVAGLAALAGLATAVSRLEEQRAALARLEKKLDALASKMEEPKSDSAEV